MRKNMKNTIAAFLFLILGVFTVLLTYLHFFASDDRKISGEWIANQDMTEQAALTALNWLQDMEAVSISMEDMEFYMQDLTIRINMTLEQTARYKGTFHCNVLPESYEACNQAAYEAFAMAFRDLLAERLRMAGYTGGTDEKTIEALVNETFGMSTVSYLMSYGPPLLPSLDELQARYGGSGTYEVEKGILTRQFDGSQPVTRKEHYIRKDSNLILSEEIGSGSFLEHYPIIYTLN